MVEKLLVKKIKNNHSIGDFIESDSTYILLDKDTDVITNKDKYLLRFRKSRINNNLIDLAFECYNELSKIKTNNRGDAAGIKSMGIKKSESSGLDKSDQWVNSTLIGYYDSVNERQPCRETAFTRNHFDLHKKGLPFLQTIDRLYKELSYDHWNKQNTKAQESMKYIIEGTCFSTITVNRNFRTALHRDKGDYEEGMGNLVVIGHFEGGELLFPDYKIGVKIKQGDFLLMDVHERHCNNPILIMNDDDKSFRISFVSYLRKYIDKCERLEIVFDSLKIRLGTDYSKQINTQRKLEFLLDQSLENSVVQELPEDWRLRVDSKWLQFSKFLSKSRDLLIIHYRRSYLIINTKAQQMNLITALDYKIKNNSTNKE